MEQIEIILLKQKCLKQALSLRVGVDNKIPESLVIGEIRQHAKTT